MQGKEILSIDWYYNYQRNRQIQSRERERETEGSFEKDPLYPDDPGPIISIWFHPRAPLRSIRYATVDINFHGRLRDKLLLQTHRDFFLVTRQIKFLMSPASRYVGSTILPELFPCYFVELILLLPRSHRRTFPRSLRNVVNNGALKPFSTVLLYELVPESRHPPLFSTISDI